MKFLRKHFVCTCLLTRWESKIFMMKFVLKVLLCKKLRVKKHFFFQFQLSTFFSLYVLVEWCFFQLKFNNSKDFLRRFRIFLFGFQQETKVSLKLVFNDTQMLLNWPTTQCSKDCDPHNPAFKYGQGNVGVKVLSKPQSLAHAGFFSFYAAQAVF